MSNPDDKAMQTGSGNLASSAASTHFLPSVCVIGLGYIGLPTAAVLASRGIQVHGCDVNGNVVDTINRGEIHIVEPELDVVVHAVVNSGFLRAATAPQTADVFIIAVPTPFKDGRQPDISFIQAAAEAVAPLLEAGNLVILESTSPVGATEQLAEWLAEKRPDLSFPQQGGEAAQIHIAHCPERVLPGNALRELVENDRVIGGMTAECSNQASDFYARFVSGALVQTDVRTAELCKLSENAFRDVNIAFANELSLLCDRYGIDVWQLVEFANRHPRVNILQPGAGVGGHCIAVDPWFIISQAPDLAPLMRTARQVNDHKPEYIVELVRKAAEEVENPVIACLGLAFKPDVDDLRESPAVRIAEMLAKDKDLNIIAIEPHVRELPSSLRNEGNVSLESFKSASSRANIMVGLVRHRILREECRNHDLSKFKFLDFVNLLQN